MKKSILKLFAVYISDNCLGLRVSCIFHLFCNASRFSSIHSSPSRLDHTSQVFALNLCLNTHLSEVLALRAVDDLHGLPPLPPPEFSVWMAERNVGFLPNRCSVD